MRPQKSTFLSCRQKPPSVILAKASFCHTGEGRYPKNSIKPHLQYKNLASWIPRSSPRDDNYYSPRDDNYYSPPDDSYYSPLNDLKFLCLEILWDNAWPIEFLFNFVSQSFRGMNLSMSDKYFFWWSFKLTQPIQYFTIIRMRRNIS